jgi:hypothetical protein
MGVQTSQRALGVNGVQTSFPTAEQMMAAQAAERQPGQAYGTQTSLKSQHAFGQQTSMRPAMDAQVQNSYNQNPMEIQTSYQGGPIGVQTSNNGQPLGVQTSFESQSSPEIARLNQRIKDLEEEIGRQKSEYSRKQSVRSSHNGAELEKQREYIQQLESQIENLKNQMNQQVQRQQTGKSAVSMHSFGGQKTDDVQQRILEEIQFLKGNPDVLQKPGTGSQESA